jgi:hypothetical protein
VLALNLAVNGHTISSTTGKWEAGKAGHLRKLCQCYLNVIRPWPLGKEASKFHLDCVGKATFQKKQKTVPFPHVRRRYSAILRGLVVHEHDNFASSANVRLGDKMSNPYGNLSKFFAKLCFSFDFAAAWTQGINPKLRLPFCVALVSSSACGCTGLASLGQPERLYTEKEEIAAIRSYFASEDPGAPWSRYFSLQPGAQEKFRNEYITHRMYAIDLEYTKYEASLTHEGQEANFLSAITNLSLNGAATLVPVVHTKNLLNQIAMGVTGVDSTYNEKILLNQTMQHIQNGMRTGRYEQATIILANMKCDVADYPLGLALSDLELYYRAGTLTSGLMKVSDTVSQAKTDAKAAKDDSSPGAAGASAVPTPARARLMQNVATAVQAAGNADATKTCPASGVRLGNGARSNPRPPRT